MIDTLQGRSGAGMPGADLLLSNSYDELMANVIDSKHIGQGVVDGVECEHLAFRGPETDWQIWIETGAKPVPRKYVITSKTVTGAPQYTLTIRDWKTDANRGCRLCVQGAGRCDQGRARFHRHDRIRRTSARHTRRSKEMTVLSRKLIVLAAAAAALGRGLFWNGETAIDGGLVTSAEARVGRPLTPMSYAGVARRTTRRAVAVGAGAAARRSLLRIGLRPGRRCLRAGRHALLAGERALRDGFLAR